MDSISFHGPLIMLAGSTEGTGPRQSLQRGILLALALLATACAAPRLPAPDRAAPVLPGIDVLLRDDAAALAGRRVGLITNHTGIDRAGTSTIDRLHTHPAVQLVALFSPEHSITGRAEAGAHVDSSRDPRTGLPIYSLYGQTRKPTAEMLRDVDALVFDIQDIGTRYYTYVWTMALALQAAAENGREFVVLDRPNPIGGTLAQGNVLDDAYRTFVGLYPVPMRHGLTPGELALLLNEEHGIGARLTVVPVANWRRSQWFDATGLPWVAPSPNMPSLESATHYPGTCLFEGTNVSVGRGTGEAFAQIGAPWIDGAALAERLRRYNLPGVRFEPVSFTPQAPGDGKYGDTIVSGVRFVTTDRATYDPTLAGMAALVEIRALYGDRLTFAVSHFDRLAGTDRVRAMILDGATLERITASWPAQIEAFERVRRRYLIYSE
jgi:uncharacterized protein YbbC (DUF1343 family)